jgi:hypothetical protein
MPRPASASRFRPSFASPRRHQPPRSQPRTRDHLGQLVRFAMRSGRHRDSSRLQDASPQQHGLVADDGTVVDAQECPSPHTTGRSSQASRIARVASSVRDWMPVRSKTRPRCASTVLLVTPSASQTSSFVSPSATRRTTSASRGISTGGCGSTRRSKTSLPAAAAPPGGACVSRRSWRRTRQHPRTGRRDGIGDSRTH